MATDKKLCNYRVRNVRLDGSDNIWLVYPPCDSPYAQGCMPTIKLTFYQHCVQLFMRRATSTTVTQSWVSVGV